MKRSWVWAVLAIAFSCAGAPLCRGTLVDLLFVAADDAALRPILQRLTDTQVETHGAWTLWRGALEGKSIVLARTEGDPLNAVAATTLAVRRYPPRLIIVFGTSRAHDPDLRPGDIVMSERFCAFDGAVSRVAALGEGSDPLRWRKLPHPLMTRGERETPTEFFPADSAALGLARGLKPERGRLVAGVLGSAHQINREADRIAWLRAQWKTSTEDNESAHVAGVAALFNLPVMGFRVVDGPPAEAADFALRFAAVWK